MAQQEEQERVARLEKAAKSKRVVQLAAEMARDRETKNDEERIKRIGTIDAKFRKIRQAVAWPWTGRLLDPSMSGWREECAKRMEKTRDETKALEQAIQDSAALMQRPGWLKSAHEERRKQALAVVQTHEKGEADRGAHETAAQGEQEGWKGTDEEILKAQHTIERLEEKIRRLRERCDAAFMSEGTRAAIVNEIQKSAEMKDNLENKVSKTMHHRADQRRRVLPARPSSSWINLELLKRQHASLLLHVPLDECVQNMKQLAQEEHERIMAWESRTRQLQKDHAALKVLLDQEIVLHEHRTNAMQQQRSKLIDMVQRLRTLTEESEMADTYQAKLDELDESLVRVRQLVSLLC